MNLANQQIRALLSLIARPFHHSVFDDLQDSHTSTLNISHLIATANKDPSLFHVILRHCGLRSLATANETATASSDKLGMCFIFLAVV